MRGDREQRRRWPRNTPGATDTSEEAGVGGGKQGKDGRPEVASAGEGEALEACQARSRVHPLAHTCMAGCLAHHQRPSVGTGSPGRTALPSSRACSGIEAMTCLATQPPGRGIGAAHQVFMHVWCFRTG